MFLISFFLVFFVSRGGGLANMCDVGWFFIFFATDPINRIFLVIHAIYRYMF